MLSNVFDNMGSKGADGLQSLAMATWQICGGPRGPNLGNTGTSPRQGPGNRFLLLSGEIGSTKEAGMKIFAWIFSAAISLLSLPAPAAPPPRPPGSILLSR